MAEWQVCAPHHYGDQWRPHSRSSVWPQCGLLGVGVASRSSSELAAPPRGRGSEAFFYYWICTPGSAQKQPTCNSSSHNYVKRRISPCKPALCVPRLSHTAVCWGAQEQVGGEPGAPAVQQGHLPPPGPSYAVTLQLSRGTRCRAACPGLSSHGPNREATGRTVLSAAGRASGVLL